MSDAPPPPQHLVDLQRAALDAQDAVRTFAVLHRHGELTPEETAEWDRLNQSERDAVLALHRALDAEVPRADRQAMSWTLRKAARGEE